MTLLPAVVPDIPEARAEVVPARLARKVAPLFGVPWPDSPLGPTTWVTDFTRITLSEIARGAPLPTRAQAAALSTGGDRGEPGAAPRRGTDSWALVDRVAVTARNASLPNEIANATLNRYGPDTRSAVILAAVNRLLDPLRAALEETMPLLVDSSGAPLPPTLRLAAWAWVVVEVFRSQPALVAAGIRARAVQRPLTTAWEVPLGASAAAAALTRCEISAPWTTAAPILPRDLDIVDATFGSLGLFPPVDESQVTSDALHEAVVGQLLYRLLDVGGLRDASHLWISARGPDQLAVEALLTPTSIVDRFVQQALRLAGPGDDAGQAAAERERADAERLPRIPDAAVLVGRPVLVRRTVTVALLGTVRQVLASAPAREHARGSAQAWLERLRAFVSAALPDDDPVRAVATCRIDATLVGLVRHDSGRGLGEMVRALRGSSQHCIDLFDAGLLDRGAAAEIVSAASIEMNAVRTTNAARPTADGEPGTDLPHPADLDQLVRERWRHWLRMVEADPEVVSGGQQPPDLLGYHLHNYAAFLASHADRVDDLGAAVTLFRDVVLPARERFLARAGLFAPLRVSLQMATVATTGLAEFAVACGDRDAARQWAALGHRWISRALTDESTAALLAEATERSCRFALRAAPALIVAAELGIGLDGERPTPQQAASLLEVASRWETSITKPGRYVRHGEIEAWSARLGRLRTG